jgi:hypothetical protein
MFGGDVSPFVALIQGETPESWVGMAENRMA